MKKRLSSMLLALVLCVGIVSQTKASAASAVPTPQQAYQAMIALKEQYPEGTSWTNDNIYYWNGGIFSFGAGCAGFSFILSDAAFGNLPARRLTQFAFSDVKVGDILRLNNDTHSVIVLEVHADHVVIAEGNYNSSVHWGRRLNSAEVFAANYVITRYPESAPASADPEPVPEFTDLLPWCEKEAIWAAQEKITNGYGASDKFAPNVDCTQAQILTFLWRAEGKPEAAKSPITAAASYQDAINWAYEQKMIDDSFSPNAPCTRSQAVSYIWQALGKPEATKTATFSDVDANAPYAEAVNWAVEKTITKGYGCSDTFAPDRVCNRGEIVTFLYRAYSE